MADFFEAITAKRHYHEPLHIEGAIDLLRKESGKHFDAKVVEALIKVLERNGLSAPAASRAP